MKRFMIVSVTVAMLLGLATSAPNPATAARENPLKVGYVDLEEVLKSDSQYQKARKKLERYKNNLKDRIDTQKQELSKLKKQLEEESSLLSEQELKKKRQTFARKAKAFQQRARRGQMLIERKKKELLAPILERVEPAVQAVAKARDYDVVKRYGQSEDSVLWVSERVDLTDAVIERMKATQ